MAGKRQPRMARFNSYAGNRLVPRVENVEQRPSRLGFELRHESSHSDDWCEGALERTMGQVPGKAHRPGDSKRQVGPSAWPTPCDAVGVAAGSSSQTSAGSPDTAIDGVEHRQPSSSNGVVPCRHQCLEASGDCVG